jgi:hypothetical protein
MPPRSPVHPRGGSYYSRKELESRRLMGRRDQESRVAVCPDCGRERTNMKRHRGSRMCQRPRVGDGK